MASRLKSPTVERLGGFDPTLWRGGERAGAKTRLLHVLRKLKKRKELSYIPQNKLVYITGEHTVPIQIRTHHTETMNRAKAEAEIENMSKAVRPKEKKDGKKDGQNRERSRSTDAHDKSGNSRDKSRGRSSSQSNDKKTATRDRSKSNTRERSESASKEKDKASAGKPAANKSDSKASGEWQTVGKKKSKGPKFLWTTAPEDDLFSDGELVEKGAGKGSESTESEDNDVMNLGRKLQDLSTQDNQWKKREREDSSSSDSPPRKTKTPEPKTLSDIDEVIRIRTQDFWAEEQEPGYLTEEERIMEEDKIMREHIDYVRSLERDIQSKDKEILSLVTKLRKTEEWYDDIIKDRDSELEKMKEAEKEGKNVSKKQEAALTEKETEAARLQMELSDKEEEYAKLKEELAEEKAKSMKNNAKLAETMEAKAEMERNIDELTRVQKSTAKLMADLAEVQAKLEETREEVVEEKGRSAWASTKLARAEEMLAEEKERAENAEKGIVRYQKRCQALEAELEAHQEQSSKEASIDMEKQLKDHESQIQTLMNEVRALKNTNEGLEGRMTGTFRQLRSIRSSAKTRNDILAVDGDASEDSDRNSESSESDNDLEESPGTEERELSEREVKAMIDSYLVWPVYEDTFSHKDFVQKCRRAAERGISRGIPKEKVATNLNVHIERKVQPIKQKFEALREEDDRDKSLEETLDMIERCGPEEHPSEQYGNMAQASREITTSYMNRVTKTHDDNFKTTNTEDRIHSIKKQFFKGLRNKPQGIEMALAGLMDLDQVAKTTQRMQEEEKKERKKQGAAEQKARNRRRESPPPPPPPPERHFRREQYRQIATVSTNEEEPIIEGTKSTERAATGEEFKGDATICKRCRMVDAHYTRQCQNAPYCSVCKSEGHTDEQHGGDQQPYAQGRGQGFRGNSRGQRGGYRGYGGRNNGPWNQQGNRWNEQGNRWNGQGNRWNGQGNQWNGQGNQWNGQNNQGNGQANNQMTPNNGQWGNQGGNQRGNQRDGPSFGPYRGNLRQGETATDKQNETSNQAGGPGNGNGNQSSA